MFKTLFADHGFCDILVTDNGPSYVSQEFETFLRDCSIKHITSSPMYPQSNGFAESMVKVMKNLITKSFEANEDPNWALLAYRATPLSASLPSPAQMLHGRPLRTNLPSPRPTAQNDDITDAQHNRQQSYTRLSKPSLPQLQHGQSVTMYNHNTHTWQPATITNVLPTPGSYMLSTDNGGSYRRNRRDIRVVPPMTPPCVTTPSTPSRAIPAHPTNCVTPSHIATTTPGSNDSVKNATQPSNGTTENEHYVTKSGRISKPASRYQ